MKKLHFLWRFKIPLLTFLLTFWTLSSFSQIQIDGNPSDWCNNVFNTGSTVTIKDLIPDPIDNTDNIWTGGSSNVSLIQNWAWTINGANDKNNIANSGFALVGSTLYFFADRHANNGDASIGFWLLKNSVTAVAGGTFSGTHADGDILLVSHFVNGGSQPDINAYVWQGGTLGGLVTSTTCTAQAAVNLDAVAVPSCWSYTSKSGPAGMYPANTFFEGSIDLCLLGQGFTACYSTFIVETSNSQSLTSSMEDLVIGRFGSIPLSQTLTGSTTCQGATGAGTLTMTSSETGVNYTLVNAAGNVSVTTQAGTGSALVWTGLAAGSYYVVAINATTNCSTTMAPVTVTIVANPTALVLTGSSICSTAPNTGTITSTTSVSGVSYQLYNSSNVAVQTAQTGTGSALTWSNLAAGNGYYVIATGASPTYCTSTSNTVNVTSVTNPTALVLTGSSICATAPNTGTITSSTSALGVSYQLYNSSNVAVQTAKAGTGSALTWSTLSAGNGYYVIGTGAAPTLCTSTSNTVNVTTVANPDALVLTGSSICASAPNTGTITSGTSALGVSYQLYNSSNTAVQSPKAGTGGALTWSNLAAGNGYYVIGTGASPTNCTSTSNSVNVTSVANPAALVLTGSSICATAPNTGTITSGTSVVGVSYQLYNSSNVAVQTAKAGTGSALTWSTLAAGNGYYVIGTGAAPTSCTSTSNLVNVTSVANPDALVLTGSSICATAPNTGTITSGTSALGVSYQLYNSSNVAVQTAKAGTGSALTWSNLAAGNGYYVIGTGAAPTNCTSSSNTVNVTSVANPDALVLSGSSICSAAINTGTITSTTSAVGVSYQLYNSSNVAVQSPKAGTGTALTWSNLAAGTGYYVIGTGAAPTNCTSTSNTVSVNSVNAPAALVLTGSSICATAPNTGTITSGTSVVGVSYQLYNGSNVAVQTAKAGTGSALTWSSLAAGNGYYVIGTGAAPTSCTSTSNTVNVTTVANPAALVLTGSSICSSAPNTGTITSGTSAVGVSYQLYNSSNVAVQSAQAGTGAALTWSNLAAGNGYYVIGTGAAPTNCTSTSNSVNVSSVANPVALVLTGSAICAANPNTGTITSTTSQVGVNYQLYNGSNVAIGTAVAGTGSMLTWNNLAVGNGYYVIGTGSSPTLCTSTSNTANVALSPTPTVTASANPVDIFLLSSSTSTLTAVGLVNGNPDPTLTYTWAPYTVPTPGYTIAPVSSLSPTTGASVVFTVPSSLQTGYIFQVTTTTTAGCSATDTVRVLTSGSFSCPDVQVPPQLCVGTAGTFTATIGSIPTYETWTWTANGATINGDTHGTIVSVTPTQAGTYTLTLTVTFSSAYAPATCTYAGTATMCVTYGCTLGFWKNHTAIWDQPTDLLGGIAVPFTTGTLFKTYFPGTYTINGINGSTTMLQALNNNGGGCAALARNAIAALLSKAAFGSTYAFPGSFTDLYNTIEATLTGGTTTWTCSTLNSALDAANNNEWNNSCSNLGAPGATKGTRIMNEVTDVQKLNVIAAPNPFTNKVRFIINSPEAGHAQLDVVNMLGQRVATVFEGNVQANSSQQVEYNVPSSAPQNMMYILRIGNQQVTGKLLRVNQ